MWYCGKMHTRRKLKQSGPIRPRPSIQCRSSARKVVVPQATQTPRLGAANLQLQPVEVLHQHALAAADHPELLSHALVVALPLAAHGPQDALGAVGGEAGLVGEDLHGGAEGRALLGGGGRGAGLLCVGADVVDDGYAVAVVLVDGAEEG